MGIELARAFVSIRGDASQFPNDVRSAAPSIMGAVQGIASKAAGVLAGIGMALGIRQIIGVFQAADDAADEFERSGIKMNLMLQNAGDRVGFTSDQLKQWIEEISSVSLTWDTELNRAAMGLLMFESISGEVFHRTLKAANDLGVILGSTESASRMLGRAMEDPARGMMFLRRAGIILTQEQQTQIKAFAAAGEKAKAQAALLDVIEKKTKGMAENYAKSAQGQEDMADKALAAVKRSMGAMWSPVGLFITKMQIAFYEVVLKVGKVVEYVVQGLSSWNDSMGGIPGQFLKASGAVLTLTVAVTALSAALAMVFVFNPIGLFALAVAGVVAGIYVWLQHTGKLKSVSENAFTYIKVGLILVGQLFRSVADFAISVWDIASTYFMEAWRTAVDYFSGLLGPYKDTISKMIGAIVANLNVMLGSWEGLREGIIHYAVQAAFGFMAVWENVKNSLLVTLLEIKGFFIDLWYSLGTYGVKYAMPTLARLFTWIAKKMAELRGEKWLVTPEEEEKIIKEEQNRALGDLGEKRAANKAAIDKAKEERRKAHEEALGGIGGAVEAEDKKWQDKMGKLPKLSDRVKDIWAAVKAAAAAALEKANLPAAPGGKKVDMRKREWAFEGTVGAGDLGRRIQDAILKPKDKNLAALERGNQLQQEANADLAAMRGRLEQIGGLV